MSATAVSLALTDTIRLVVWNAPLQDGPPLNVELRIPILEIQKFTHKPRKWFRYVAWTIIGVRGRISHSPGGPPVDEEDVSLSPDQEFFFVREEGTYPPVLI
jgi:hypothetical protein